MKYALQQLLAAVPLLAITHAGCPPKCTNPQLSCSNDTIVNDATCCFEYPGGQILQTQYWDFDPADGPQDHWTVHGLWPDNCDGTYSQYCDASREYSNITEILDSYGQTSLLSYMRKYWTDYHGQEESFWEHEWNKHGTCMNTLSPSCYTNYEPQEEVVDFFRRTIYEFKMLNTYKFLADAGIVPSSTTNYTNDAVMAALRAPRGVNATIECDDGALSEVYYTFLVRGTIQSGGFLATEPVGEGNGCPASFMYPPKNLSTKYPVSSVSSSAAATATPMESCRRFGI